MTPIAVESHLSVKKRIGAGRVLNRAASVERILESSCAQRALCLCPNWMLQQYIILIIFLYLAKFNLSVCQVKQILPNGPQQAECQQT